MAAGLGFKDFATGEVLTAADVDGYLMQGVWVFASATARDAAVTSPQEGNFAYLKDTNVTTYYTGSAWANLDTTGMTNPMTTTGDMIYSSSGSTPARLGIGTANQQLRVNAGASAPEWFTPTVAGSGLTLIDEVDFSNVSSVNVNDVFSTTYENYKVLLNAKTHSTTSGGAAASLRFRVSGTDTSTNYKDQRLYIVNTTVGADKNTFGTDEILIGQYNDSTGTPSLIQLEVGTPFLTAQSTTLSSGIKTTGTDPQMGLNGGQQTDSTSFTGFTLLFAEAATGSVFVYGYAKE
jgi:hypothetical protein